MAELPEAAEVGAPVVVDLGLGRRAQLQVAHAAQRVAQLPVLLLQLQQENRKLGYSLCGVCNLQLSSPAQAQVHYNGRSHLRRLRQLSHGDSSPAAAAASATPAGAPAPHAGLGHAPAPHVGLGHAPGHTGCSLTCSVSTGKTAGGGGGGGGS